jgi:2,3-dihydroxybenzoate decarboxylase
MWDEYGIALTILSMTSPGIQGFIEPDVAVSSAKATNEAIHGTFVEPHPDRFACFACVALQDPEAAADELERAVVELRAKGALVNGYTNTAGHEMARYLDEPEIALFWEKVAELGVPVYLHPREPLPSQQRTCEEYSSLVGSAGRSGTRPRPMRCVSC